MNTTLAAIRASTAAALLCCISSAQGGLTWLVNPANGHSYALTAPMTWTQAEAAAVQVGGHLATVRSQAENDWIVQTFYNPANYLWIGYSDEAQEGVWVWSSNEPAAFTTWGPGQPDNYQGIQDYAAIWDSPVGSWTDHEGTGLGRGVIEAIPSATFLGLGAGCPGTTGVPTMTPSVGSLPRLGSTFQLDLANLPQGLAVALGAIGFSASTWQGVPLPRDLAVMGMPGCTQYVSLDFTYFMLSVGGTTTWTIPIPAIPSMVGLPFFVQALVPDQAANPFGATVTNAGAAIIGA